MLPEPACRTGSYVDVVEIDPQRAKRRSPGVDEPRGTGITPGFLGAAPGAAELIFERDIDNGPGEAGDAPAAVDCG